MRHTCALLVLLVFLICLSPAGAAVINFTGDVKADFAGYTPAEDTVADPDKDNQAGCNDGPLNRNAFLEPQPLNNQVPPSGFNISHVYSVYDCETDTLFVGMDVCDPRIAWDADTDGNITTFDANAVVPGFSLQSSFRDDGLEDYELEVDVNPAALYPSPIAADFRVMLVSGNGGATYEVLTFPSALFASEPTPGKLFVQQTMTGPDVEISIHGIRTVFPHAGASIPVRVLTRSGGTSDLSNEDVTDAAFQLACAPEITVTKGVSCSETGPFDSSVDVVRGANAYFRITVENTGDEPLQNVVITDEFMTNGACCPLGSCIPEQILVGNLAVGEMKTYSYTVPTNPAYATIGVNPDCTNSASASGVGVRTGVLVQDGPKIANVNVLVPSLTCEKLVDDDDDPDPDEPGDPTPPVNKLNLSTDGTLEVEHVWYWVCLRNNGETGIDFTPVTGGDCPSITDSLLDSPIPGVTLPPDTNVGELVRAAIQTKYGSLEIPAGGEVCVPIGGATGIALDETALCPDTPTVENTFSACGIVTGTCLPLTGGEEVRTSCTAEVHLCPPRICIEKLVSCDPLEGFAKSVKALRGAPVYFQIVVTNCGGEDLRDVVVTDTLSNLNGALLACTDCTNTDSCLPGMITIGDLPVGESRTFVCTVPTNPAFGIFNSGIDATNTASVVGFGVSSGTEVDDGPESATVDVLVPRIECNKLIDNDDNPVPGAPDTDGKLPTAHLNLADDDTDLGIEQAWYYLYVGNTGEVDVDFSADGDPSCPSFTDAFLEGSQAGITGLSQDLDALFRAALQTKYGSHVLPSGGNVYIIVGPVGFDELALCGTQNVFPDTFTACGIATQDDICVPPGGEVVTTGECNADVTICPGPCISITKEVSCDPLEDFGASATALRGADVYFKIVVTNCGGEDLLDVKIADVMEDPNGALLDCAGCTDGINCIPGEPISLGDIGVGQSRSFVCTFPTNPLFDTKGIDPDATNSVRVIEATAERSRTILSTDWVSAEVDVLVPELACSKRVDNDDNFADDPMDDHGPTTDLNLRDLPFGVKSVWYELCVENTGETDVTFEPGTDPDCPSFVDEFLETADPAIPGTGVDLDALFQAALQARPGGGLVLEPGEKICIVVGGDDGIILDEDVLCPQTHTLTDQFQACGLATGDDICLPDESERHVSTEVCEATVRICSECIEITKGVSCSPIGPFGPSVTAVAGSTIYFQVAVTNCGGVVLNDVTVADILTDDNNALLDCTGCTNIAGCIPGIIKLGSLDPGQTKEFVCTVPTNADFAVPGLGIDATNCASVTAVGGLSGQLLTRPAVCATVDLLVPAINCNLTMDDDANFAPDAGDLTPPSPNQNRTNNGQLKIELVWYQCVVSNDGEVDCDFAEGADPNCPAFPGSIPGIADIGQLFRDKLFATYGNYILPANDSVIVETGPVQFDEDALCPTGQNIFKPWFRAFGIATEPDVCGAVQIETDECAGTIMICEPVVFQAYPGSSNGANVHYMGYLGNSGETISAVPGMLVLIPGEKWSNFVTAAQAGIDYTLKNVSLIKKTPIFSQCQDVFEERTVGQQGTANIRLVWPLMYEAPGTLWTLTIQYGTTFPWDDDGPDGENPPSYYHEDEWTWKVDATLESMKLLLELFHEVPFGTDEVPLISDEVLYPLLQAKLDEVIDLYKAGLIREASIALGEFEMEVGDACIAESPRAPYPTGPGTGIASTWENPACCKLMVDAEHVGKKLGLFQSTK